MKKFTRTRFMFQLYTRIFPTVHKALKCWGLKADKIPDAELRKQAKNSMQAKAFHCEGGSVFAFLLTKEAVPDYIEFVVAFQTISDYLDNLCDRSVEQDERHFRQLHLAMSDALKPNQTPHDYYQYGQNQSDGGYLRELVLKCQACLADCPDYSLIQSKVQRLNEYYIHLQVYKHLHPDIREEKLREWVEAVNQCEQDWYTFAAVTGSTLGIFMLVAYAMKGNLKKHEVKRLYDLYFPSIQGFHILFDYYIDQQEDEQAGDLNFYTYFMDDAAFYQHMYGLYWQVSRMHTQVKDGDFHMMLMYALLGMYLADDKVKLGRNGTDIANRLLEIGGKQSRFFYRQVKGYRKLQGFWS